MISKLVIMNEFPDQAEVVLQTIHGDAIGAYTEVIEDPQNPDPGNGNGNGTEPPLTPVSVRYRFVPVWEIGGSPTNQPTIGSGVLTAELVATPTFDGRTLCNLTIDLVSARLPTPTLPGIGSGSYQFYFPSNADWSALLPPEPVLDGDGNVIAHDFVRSGGSFVAWIAGGGAKHFSGSVKWTFREFRAGGPSNPRPKLIMVVAGDEWKPSHPKNITSDFNITASIAYVSRA